MPIAFRVRQQMSEVTSAAPPVFDGALRTSFLSLPPHPRRRRGGFCAPTVFVLAALTLCLVVIGFSFGPSAWLGANSIVGYLPTFRAVAARKRMAARHAKRSAAERLKRAEVTRHNTVQLDLDFWSLLPPPAKTKNNFEAKSSEEVLFVEGARRPAIVGVCDTDGQTYVSMNDVFSEGFGPPKDRAARRRAVSDTHHAKKTMQATVGSKTRPTSTTTRSKHAANDDVTPAVSIDVYDPIRGFYGVVEALWAGEPASDWGVTATPPEFVAADESESRAFISLLERGWGAESAAATATTAGENPAVRFGIRGSATSVPPPRGFLRQHKERFGAHSGSSSSAAEFEGIFIGRGRALDVGAGIGRIALNVLAPLGFDTIDVVEPMGHLLDVAKERLAAMGRLGAAHEASVELLEWPSEPTYDLISAQWVAMYLTDNDLVAFLKSAKQALRRNGTFVDVNGTAVATTGVIFIKDNISPKRRLFVVHKDEHPSISRTLPHFMAAFRAAGLRVLHHTTQRRWPSDSYPMEMFALVSDGD